MRHTCLGSVRGSNFQDLLAPISVALTRASTTSANNSSRRTWSFSKFGRITGDYLLTTDFDHCALKFFASNNASGQGLPGSSFDYPTPFLSSRLRRSSGLRRNGRTRKNIWQCYPKGSSPPKRDTGIASEQDWGISLKSQPINESGLSEDGSTWYRENGEDEGENGYRCRWTIMGGRNAEGTSEWKETWWEKSDWTGYKELGAEKSGRNPLGDSWWETWQEVLRQDESGSITRIEKSAHKQAKSYTDGMWNEKWWEKHNSRGWAEKGAQKYGRSNDQSWWEKWGEQFDGQGAVVKWTDKWAEKDNGNKWGDKWEERFDGVGVGKRQGETWHVSTTGSRWTRTWGEEHMGDGKVHKYGRSSSGEQWDVTINEPTYYESKPHVRWEDVVASSSQLLAIERREQEGQGNKDIDEEAHSS